MNTRLKLLLLGLVCGCLHTAKAQTTAFSYQGVLAVNGAPANGQYDLTFTLYDSVVGGQVVAGPVSINLVRITNGLFTVMLDLGSAPFSGGSRWMEIATHTSYTPNPPTTLRPRQPITPAPFAISAGGLTGRLSPANLPGNALTNHETQATTLDGGVRVNNGATLYGGLSAHGNITLSAGQFVGNGAGLTNLQVGNVSVNALTNHQTSATFLDGGLQVSNAATVLGGLNVRGGVTALDTQFNGNGAGLTGLNAANLSSGTVADARLSTNVALLNGSNVFKGVTVLTNASNQFVGAFVGNGAALSNLPPGNLPPNLLTNHQSTATFFDAGLQASNSATVLGGLSVRGGVTALDTQFNGNGAGLTALNAANVSSGTLADARLSANVALLNGNQTFSGSNTFSSTNFFGNSANRFVGAFVGNGAALSNLPPGNLPPNLLTNHQSTATFFDAGLQASNSATVLGGLSVRGGVTALDTQFNGNGAGLTGLNAANISSGTLADARLSANIPLLNGGQTFAGSNTFNGVNVLTNVQNQFAGNGAGLTGLNAANVASGTLADARLSANVALLNANQTFTGSNTFSSTNFFGNSANRFVGAFVGNGAALSNLPPGNLPPNLLTNHQSLATFLDAGLQVSNSATVLGGLGVRGGITALDTQFNGNGAGLTGLSAANISSGTIADARLSANVALLNANQTFSGSNTFSSTNFFGNSANRFVGAFVGNGAALSNLPPGNLPPNLLTNHQTTPTFFDGGLQVTNGASVTGGLSVRGGITALDTQLNGNGAGLTSLNAANISTGTLPDAQLSANVPLLNGNQTFAGSNTFANANFFGNSGNRFVGVFTGNGAGLTNLTGIATNTVILAGDVTGPQGTTTVARIRGVNLATTGPVANQHLRFDGANWTPSLVALGTDVSGTLGLAAGGTAASTAAGARANLGAAASGANADITSLGALTTPLTAAQGGSGQSSYTIGDMLYASAPNTLSRLSDAATGNALISGGAGTAPGWGKIGLGTHVTGTLSATNGGTGQTGYAPGDLLYASSANTLSRLPASAPGQVLGIASGLPVWTPITNHNHFGQIWVGVNDTADGLNVQNASGADGSSSLTGVASGTNNLNYGVFGQSSSTNGAGVQGLVLAPSGFAIGVAGESDSTNGAGVYGIVPVGTGNNVGVWGESDSVNGTGVYGVAGATNGTPIGVYGDCYATNGYGLYTPSRLYVGGTAYLVGSVAVGTLYANSGTSNFPAITFNNSSSAGMYNPVTNALGFSTAGLERLRIAADGKIGIGVNSPTNLLQLAGGARSDGVTWINGSDRNSKEHFAPVDSKEMLAKVAALPISRWNYKSDPSAEHVGPVAQDFHAAFGLGSGETGIATVDEEGVALAAIQGLAGIVKEKEAEIQSLKAQNQSLEQRMEALERMVNALTR